MDQRRTNMKGRRRTPKQVVRTLREADRLLAEGKGIPEVAKAEPVAEGDRREQGAGRSRA
jgi:hypothetical protein